MGERRPWTEEEDNALKHLKDQLQVKKWSEISRRMAIQFNIKERNGKQCRERYLNHLDSSIIARDLTSSDEEKLFKLHDEMGNKWSVIGKYFQGRTVNQIKNYFHSKLRKGMRKLNKEIKKIYKNMQRPFKLNIIYKIVEASDFRFSDKLVFNQNTIRSFNDLKNIFLEYAGGKVSKTELSDLMANQQVFQLVQKLKSFEKSFKSEKQNFSSQKQISSQTFFQNQKRFQQVDLTSYSQNQFDMVQEISIEKNKQINFNYEEESIEFIVSLNSLNDDSYSKKLHSTPKIEQKQANNEIIVSLGQKSNYFYSFQKKNNFFLNDGKILPCETNIEFEKIDINLIKDIEYDQSIRSQRYSATSFQCLRDFDDNLNESQIKRILKRFQSYSDIEAGLFE